MNLHDCRHSALCRQVSRHSFGRYRDVPGLSGPHGLRMLARHTVLVHHLFSGACLASRLKGGPSTTRLRRYAQDESCERACLRVFVYPYVVKRTVCRKPVRPECSRGAVVEESMALRVHGRRQHSGTVTHRSSRSQTHGTSVQGRAALHVAPHAGWVRNTPASNHPTAHPSPGESGAPDQRSPLAESLVCFWCIPRFTPHPPLPHVGKRSRTRMKTIG